MTKYRESRGRVEFARRCGRCEQEEERTLPEHEYMRILLDGGQILTSRVDTLVQPGQMQRRVASIGGRGSHHVRQPRDGLIRRRGELSRRDAQRGHYSRDFGKQRIVGRMEDEDEVEVEEEGEEIEKEDKKEGRKKRKKR